MVGKFRMIDRRNLTVTLTLFLLVLTLYINAEVPVRNANTDQLDAIVADQNPPGANACSYSAFYDWRIWDRPLHLQTIAYSWNGNNLIDSISSKQPRLTHLTNYEKNIFINHFR